MGGINITLINTHNKTVNNSNTTYIDGVAVSGEGSVEFVTSNKTRGTSGNDDATTYLVDCTTGAIIFTLPAADDYGIGNTITIKKIDNSVNAITITPDGSELIDDAATLIVSVQYDAPKLISDGFNWWII